MVCVFFCFGLCCCFVFCNGVCLILFFYVFVKFFGWCLVIVFIFFLWLLVFCRWCWFVCFWFVVFFIFWVMLLWMVVCIVIMVSGVFLVILVVSEIVVGCIFFGLINWLIMFIVCVCLLVRCCLVRKIMEVVCLLIRWGKVWVRLKLGVKLSFIKLVVNCVFGFVMWKFGIIVRLNLLFMVVFWMVVIIGFL